MGWSFPFLDLLGDGYSSFTWAPAQMISHTNDIAIEGSKTYGTAVSAAAFSPNCEAYERAADDDGGAAVALAANATDGSDTFVRLRFAPLDAAANPFPLALYQNITNQPIFANGTQCDRQIRLFNSTLNQGAFAPVPVRGSIATNLAPLDTTTNQGLLLTDDVFGMLIDTPFIEYNGLDCQSLQGYSGTGPGD